MCYKINRTRIHSGYGQKWRVLETCPFWNRWANILRRPWISFIFAFIEYIFSSFSEYGGIYLDTDEIVLKSFDEFRNYSITLCSEIIGNNLANGIIVAVRNTTFVHMWLEQYKNYSRYQWAHHSTIVPYELSITHPDIIHVVHKLFVDPIYTQVQMIFENNFNWAKNYGLHLYLRFYKSHDSIENIASFNTTLGSLGRFILFDKKTLCLWWQTK